MKRYLFFFISIFIFLPIYAAKNSKKSFEEKLEQALLKLQIHRSFEVEFKQEFYSILRNKTSLSQGIIQIRAPHDFRFEMQKPRTEVYVSNGIDFWKFNPTLKHAQHLNAHSLELSYLSLLMNPAQIKTVYKISPWIVKEDTLFDDVDATSSSLSPAAPAENVFIKLEPKGDKQQKVLYAILNLKGLLKELRVVQLNGNRMRLVFGELKDKEFSKEHFSFIPPSGIVVDSN